MKGVFDLATAKDLLRKLEADHKRVHADPLDSFAAFDFVVTAWHLLEWAHPTDAAARKALYDADPLLGVCEHLAVGAKHFAPTSPKHTSVASTDVEGFWAKGFWAPNFWAKGVWGGMARRLPRRQRKGEARRQNNDQGTGRQDAHVLESAAYVRATRG